MTDAWKAHDEAALPAGDPGTTPEAAARSCRLPAAPPLLTRFGDLYGASESMQNLFRLIAKVAPTQANVLVAGESGTGKELVASTIHKLSSIDGPTANAGFDGPLPDAVPSETARPFVALNCGAISPQLIEAELFGHERGSFTGAVRMHKGCFERADGGTLFLDEITEMPLEMQVRLLRVLETGQVCRVGGDEEIAVRVRVVAATNRDPQKAVESGVLRSDLFYRLSVFPIEMPPLRERREDIELLANLFLANLNKEAGTNKILSRSARRFLNEYRWPGNVRELKNLVQRAFILADRELDVTSIMPTPRPPASTMDGDCLLLPLGSRLADAEQQLICATLGHCGGNKTRAAEVLGVSLKTLYNRLNEYESRAAEAGGARQPKTLNGTRN
jgi:DNA-binding NtrC family response regulator